MARARNIKPGFFQNENLVEHPFEVRLLFIGLWTLADKKGRLEDRPKKIKMGVFPADDVNVEKGLALLCTDKFIDRYEVNGVKYIQITNWEKHQAPHHTEKDSVIPPLNNCEVTDNPQKQDGGNPPDSLIHRFTDSTPTSEVGLSQSPQPQPERAPQNETRQGSLCKRLRLMGIDAAPHLAAWPSLLAGYSDEQILSAAEKARESKPGERIHLNYLAPMLADIKTPKARGSPSGKHGLREDYLRQQGYSGGSDGNSGGECIDGTAERVA